MFRPHVGYAKTVDGMSIAYTTVGDGPVSIVISAPLIGQLEIAWEEPAFESFVTRLAVGARVILFDRRGSGLSDPALKGPEHLVLPRLASDVVAVLDANHVQQAVVMGMSIGGSVAMQVAAEHADRVCALVVFGGAARLTKADGYDIGVDQTAADAWIEKAVALWGTGASVDADGPTIEGNERYRSWLARLERHTSSPAALALTLRAMFRYDVRPLLNRITAPTLIAHRRDDGRIGIAHARYLSRHIPGATLVELPGREHTYFLGPQTPTLTAFRTFIDTNVRGSALGAAVKRVERRGPHGAGWGSLTPRDREVAALVAQGLTNAEIAKRLRVSRFTVDGRLRRVFAKLGVSTRVEVSAEYFRFSQR